MPEPLYVADRITGNLMVASRVLLVAGGLVLLTGGAPVAAQTSWSLTAGVGQPAWSGPYVVGGKFAVSLLAVSLQRPMGGGWTGRAEVGAQDDVGDLGITGLFELPTSVAFYRAHLAAIARRRAGSGPFFMEAGAALWLQTGCDVDTSGGPGYFGGQTVGCDDWRDDASTESSNPTLRPKSTGFNLLVGAGVQGRRFGALVRFEPIGTAVIQTDAGAIRARSLTLALQWTPIVRP
ncbi:MAG: hypothetical protein ABIR59_10455 [Gemmatimonadales bacterium]